MAKALVLKNYRMWIELVLLVAHIGAVILIFRTIEDRRLAGVIAGTLFLEISTTILVLEIIWGRGLRSLAFWGAVFFLVVSALPVMILRFAFWEIPFDSIELMGITGRQLHTLANATYMGIIAMVILEGMREHR